MYINLTLQMNVIYILCNSTLLHVDQNMIWIPNADLKDDYYIEVNNKQLLYFSGITKMINTIQYFSFEFDQTAIQDLNSSNFVVIASNKQYFVLNVSQLQQQKNNYRLYQRFQQLEYLYITYPVDVSLKGKIVARCRWSKNQHSQKLKIEYICDAKRLYQQTKNYKELQCTLNQNHLYILTIANFQLLKCDVDGESFKVAKLPIKIIGQPQVKNQERTIVKTIIKIAFVFLSAFLQLTVFLQLYFKIFKRQKINKKILSTFVFGIILISFYLQKTSIGIYFSLIVVAIIIFIVQKPILNDINIDIRKQFDEYSE